MPRTAQATRDTVQSAIEALRADGRTISVAAIRREIGGGSYSTILTILDELEAVETPPPPKDLPSEIPQALAALAPQVWKAAADAARAEVQERLAEREAELADTRAELESARQEIARLEQELAQRDRDLVLAAEARAAHQAEVEALKAVIAAEVGRREVAEADAQMAREGEGDARAAVVQAIAGQALLRERLDAVASSITGATEASAAATLALLAERLDAAAAKRGDISAALSRSEHRLAELVRLVRRPQTLRGR